MRIFFIILYFTHLETQKWFFLWFLCLVGFIASCSLSPFNYYYCEIWIQVCISPETEKKLEHILLLDDITGLLPPVLEVLKVNS